MNDSRYEAIYCEIHDYVTAELEGDVTPTKRSDFEELLLGDESARQLYVVYMQELVSLRWSYAHEPLNLLDHMERNTSALLNHSADDLAQSSNLQRSRSSSVLRWQVVTAATFLVVLFTAWLVANRDERRIEKLAASQNELQDAPDDTAYNENRKSPWPPVPDATLTVGTAVATVTRISDATWAPGSLPPTELTRLRIGKTLVLETGQVELLFDKGVEVILKGRTHFEIRTATSAYSRLGSISARVGDEAQGFTIETPNARVIDLGTEFGVSISDAGETEVAVFQGNVDLAVDSSAVTSSAPVSKRLNQGEALRVGSDGNLHRMFTIDSNRFPSAAANHSPQADRLPLISDVRDNIRDPQSVKYYKIVRSGLQENAPAFVDRVHQWNGVDARGIPTQLLGAEYVMPFNDDKHFTSHLEITLFIDRPASLYLFLSDAVEPPDWLKSSFIDTGEDIGLDEGPSRWHPAGSGRRSIGTKPGQSIDTIFSIWKKDVQSPSRVVVGSVDRPRQTKGYNMYGIAAVPLE